MGSSRRSNARSGSSQRRKKAAATLQRAYRRFRKQFPGATHRGSASPSSSPRIYQDDEAIAAQLAPLFARELTRLARMNPVARDEEIAAALAAGKVVAARGMVRAVHQPATGRMAFTGGAAASAWAVRGYETALRAEPAVADLTGAQTNYLLLRIQHEHVPQIASAVLRHPRPRVLRSEFVRKSLSPRHGIKARELVWAHRPAAQEVVVGAPGDAFRIRPDMRRFLHRALGGFARYDWRMNPRRRRRRRGKMVRAKRWVMHSNLGVGARTLYAWLREMYGWRERMDRSRNWAALYPRPLIVPTQNAPSALLHSLPASLRDMLRRHVFGIDRGSRMSSSSVGPFPGVETRTDPRRAPVRQRRVAGIFGDGRHAGVFALFYRSEDEAKDLTRPAGAIHMVLLDPLGMMTFPAEIERTMQRELEAAANRLGSAALTIRVARVAVPRRLAVQYATEGSCGPSSIALLMSMLRALRSAETPMAAIEAAFRGVSDEDVVLAAQLQHSAVL